MAEDKDEPTRSALGADDAPDAEAREPAEAPPDPVPAPQPAVAPAPQLAAAPVKTPSRAPILIGALILGALGGLAGGAALRYLDGEGDADAPLAALNARILELEKKAASGASAVSALQGRVAAAEGARAPAGDAGALDAAAGAAKAAADKAEAAARRAESIGAEVAAKAAAAVAQPAAAMAAAPAPDLAPVQARVDTVASRLQGLEAQLRTRLDELSGKLGAVETQANAPKVDEGVRKELENAVEERKRRDALHATALTATMLRDHVVSGDPYDADLSVLRSLGVDAARLAPLLASAKTGAPSVADLAESFSRLAPTLELSDPPKDAGLVERLKHDALALVRVRREAEPSEENIPGRLAAIGAALKRGDVDKAYALWSQLPENLKAKSASWGAAARARLDAVAAANAIEADAAAALARTPS